MSDSPLRTAQQTMSGNVTADRVARAEAAAVTPKKRRKKTLRQKPPAQTFQAPARSQTHVDARTAAIEAQRRADEAELRRRGLRR